MRLEVAMKLRQCIEQLGGKAVDLFQIIAKGEDVASVEEAGDSGDQAESVFQGEKMFFSIFWLLKRKMFVVYVVWCGFGCETFGLIRWIPQK